MADTAAHLNADSVLAVAFQPFLLVTLCPICRADTGLRRIHFTPPPPLSSRPPPTLTPRNISAINKYRRRFKTCRNETASDVFSSPENRTCFDGGGKGCMRTNEAGAEGGHCVVCRRAVDFPMFRSISYRVLIRSERSRSAAAVENGPRRCIAVALFVSLLPLECAFVYSH